MSTITTRAAKGTPLTHAEVDANFTNLNADKLDTAGIALGSAASPTIKFTGDVNTGIYSPGADQVAVSTGGAERVRVDSSGRVGIGTSSPVQKLEVNGGSIGVGNAAGTDAKLSFDVIGVAGGAIGFNDSGNTNIYGIPDNTAYVGLAQSFPLAFSTGAQERLRIDSSGRVGIGISSPSGGLQLNNPTAGSAADFVISNPANNWSIKTGTTTNALSFVDNQYSAERLRIDYLGNVGIGTSAPSAALDVVSASIGVAEFNGPANATVSFTGTSFAEGKIQCGAEFTIGSTNNFPTAFVTNNTERLRIDSSGNVGIGTSSPQNALVVSNAGAEGLEIVPSASGSPTVIAFNRGTGSYAPLTLNGSEQRFQVGGTERLRIDSSGRVGIGTSSVSSKLHVQDAHTLSAGTQIALIENTTVGEPASLAFLAKADNGGVGNQGAIYFDAGASGTTNDNKLQFTAQHQDTITPAMTLDGAGRLGIGTSSVYLDYNGSTAGWSGSLVVARNVYDGVAQFQNWNNTANLNSEGGTSIFISRSKSGTVGTHTALASGDDIGSLIFNASDGSNFRTAASIKAVCDAGVSTADVPGRLVFSTTRDGQASPTERLRISNDGWTNLFVTNNDGFQSRNSAAAGTSFGFFVGRHSATGTTDGTISYAVYTNGNVQNTNGSYTTLSDAKLKENIVDAGSQWNDLKAIQIRNWNFKAETGHETHRQIGPIAQELETVCPGLVFETPDRDEDGNETGEVTKGVNQSVLYMKAVKALQEAMERIEVLEQRLTDAGIA